MPAMMRAGRRGRLSSVCLVVCLLGWLPSCLSQNELRSIALPYPMSFDFNELSGAHATRGPYENGTWFYPQAEKDGRVFVGATELLFAVDPVTFETVESVQVPSSDSSCIKNCENHVRLIQPLSDGELLVCIASRTPFCERRSPGNLSNVQPLPDHYDAILLPYLPHQNFTWIWLSSRPYVYSAAYETFNSAGVISEPVISRDDLTDGRRIRTKKDTNVLNDPTGGSLHFVGDPIEYNGRIYFFFREVAVEDVDEKVYSRVGVVCENDTGGTEFLALADNNLVTFVKARLGCSIGGSSPYEYNEIQDTYRSTVNDTVVFAIFSASPLGVASSAVCAFRLDDIETLFLTGSKFYKKSNRGEFDVDPFTPRQATCPNTTAYSSADYTAILENGQLMHDVVQDVLFYDTEEASSSSYPLLVLDGERFTQLVVDEDVVNTIDVMLIGTEKGTVLKAYLNENRTQARVVEEIRLETNVTRPVRSMLKSEDGQAVFVGTSYGVYRVPVQHCLDYPTRAECLDARDPYCSWNTTASCVHGTGEQNLDAGSGGQGPEPTLNIRYAPRNEQRVLQKANQPVNLFLAAVATPPGRNPRVQNDEIPCDPCASLPYTNSTFTSSGTEFLVLHINGTSASENCSCSCVVEIDGGLTATAEFNITVDDSVFESLNSSQMMELEKFDREIQDYKTSLSEWLVHVGEKLGITNVKICPASGCN